MPKPRSANSQGLDLIQGALSGMLTAHGFLKQGRRFVRWSEDKVAHVLAFQMSRWNPPNRDSILDVPASTRGQFVIELGVCVPDVARHLFQQRPPLVPSQQCCCVRQRIARPRADGGEEWWSVTLDPALVRELRRRSEEDGWPFFDRFRTRATILREFDVPSGLPGWTTYPVAVAAILWAIQGDPGAARSRLRQAWRSSDSEAGRSVLLRIAKALALGDVQA